MRGAIGYGLVVFVACCLLMETAVSAAPLVRDYELDAEFFPSESRMTGRVVVHFDREGPVTTNAVFYLHGELRVDSIIAGSRSVSFEERSVFYDFDYSLIGNEVRLPGLNGPATQIDIFYSGFFHPSKARSPSDYMRIDTNGVFLRAYGYSLWFPVFLPPGADDVVTDFSRVTIRTPAEFNSVFVGTRTGEFTADGHRTTAWTAKGVSLFAAQCTAQRYEVTAEGDYFLYHYPDSLSVAMAKTIMALASTLNSEYGSCYRKGRPGGQFFLLEMPQYGDISSGNVTGITYWIWQKFTEDENTQRALAHELVHPYLDVHVTRSDSLFALAVEGFPSYFHLPILARHLGDDFYNRFLGWMEKLYLDKRAGGTDRWGNTAPPEKALLAISADELSTYKDEFVLSDRALLFLNYLYARMGETAFCEFTAELFNRESLTTQDFRDLIEQHLPGSAADIETWIATTDYPDHLRFENFRRASGR